MERIRAKFGMRQKSGNEQSFRLFSLENIRNFLPGTAPADNFRHLGNGFPEGREDPQLRQDVHWKRIFVGTAFDPERRMSGVARELTLSERFHK